MDTTEEHVANGGILQISWFDFDLVDNGETIETSPGVTEKPQCDICGKFYKTKHQLRNHKKIHKIKNSKCEECEKIFSTNAKLENHKRTVHTTDTL